MATSLQSLPSSGDPANDPGVQELTRFIRRASGKFALIIAVCNRVDYRDQCIEFLAEQFKGNSSVVALPAGTEDLLIPAKYTAQSGAQLIQLTDLELSAPENESSLTAVRNLNLHRGDWPTLGCPVILWVAEYLLGILLRRAPDFADWRSGTVILTSPERSPTVFTELTARNEDTHEDGEYNTAAERQARIAELMERLAPAKTEQGIADATDHIQALWMRELATHLIRTGKTEEGERWANAAIRYWEKAESSRELLLAWAKLADARVDAGGLQSAILALEEQALPIGLRLLEEAPQSPLATRDLSVTLNKLGDLLMQRGQPGDEAQAFQYCHRSLELVERLLALYPQSLEFIRDVSVGLSKLADFLVQRGKPRDLVRASRHYERSLSLLEQIFASHPQSADIARGISLNLSKLADCLMTRGRAGDIETALRYYERSHRILEQLLVDSGHSARAERDLVVSLLTLADVLTQRGQAGDDQKAHVLLGRSLAIHERLLAANPHSAEASRDVSSSLERFGDFLVHRGHDGDRSKALQYFERCLQIRETLAAADPDSAQAERSVSVSHFKLFSFYRASEDEPQAIEHLNKCFAILNSFVREGRPMDPQMRELYAQLAPIFPK